MAALLISVKFSYLNFDGAFPSAYGTFHDPRGDSPEINLIEVDDVSAMRANVNALPMRVLYRIVRRRAHETGQSLDIGSKYLRMC